MSYPQVEKIKDLKDKILYCLRTVKRTRNDDVYLTFCIIWFFRRDEIIEVGDQFYLSKNSMYMVREDHVKRIRAKIQNEEGKFLPDDPAVRRKRKISEEAWRDYLNFNPEMRTP